MSLDTLTFHPNRALGLIVGAIGLVLLLGLDVVFLLLLPQPPLGLRNFLWGFLFVLSLAPIGLLAYRTYGLGRAAYRLAPDRLIVEWGARLEAIPLSQVKEALAGKDIQADLKPRGIWWPGCMVGRLEAADLGAIEFLATMPQDEQVFVVTEATTFALSPHNLEEFTAALAERREARSPRPALSATPGHPEDLGAAQPRHPPAYGLSRTSGAGVPPGRVYGAWMGGAAEAVGGGRSEGNGETPEGAQAANEEAPWESIRPAFETWEVWHDRWALGLLAVSAAAVTVLFAFVLLRLPSLPVTMPLHFSADGLGTPDRTGGPRGLLILPLIGLLTLAVNGGLGGALYIWARQRAAGYLLLGSAAVVQLLVWVATLGLMARA